MTRAGMDIVGGEAWQKLRRKTCRLQFLLASYVSESTRLGMMAKNVPVYSAFSCEGQGLKAA